MAELACNLGEIPIGRRIDWHHGDGPQQHALGSDHVAGESECAAVQGARFAHRIRLRRRRLQRFDTFATCDRWNAIGPLAGPTDSQSHVPL